jgi:hypothetical protein
MTAALLVAALLAAPRPAPAPAAPPPPASAAELEERIEVLLGAIHARPPEAWRALGPGAAPALDRLANDPSALPSRRARAAEGLSYVGGPAAEASLRALAARDGLPPVVRAEALAGAGRVLPPAEVARVVGAALQGASHPVERAVAAEVLSARGPAASCADVRAQVAREAPANRPAFQRALDRCATRGR